MHARWDRRSINKRYVNGFNFPFEITFKHLMVVSISGGSHMDKVAIEAKEDNPDKDDEARHEPVER